MRPTQGSMIQREHTTQHPSASALSVDLEFAKSDLWQKSATLGVHANTLSIVVKSKVTEGAYGAPTDAHDCACGAHRADKVCNSALRLLPQLWSCGTYVCFRIIHVSKLI